MTLTPTDLQILITQINSEITRLSKLKKDKLIDSQANMSNQINGLRQRRDIIANDLIMIAVTYTDKRIKEINQEMNKDSKLDIVKA